MNSSAVLTPPAPSQSWRGRISTSLITTLPGIPAGTAAPPAAFAGGPAPHPPQRPAQPQAPPLIVERAGVDLIGADVGDRLIVGAFQQVVTVGRQAASAGGIHVAT